MSVCTGNNPWYYIGISRKGWGCKNRFNFNATQYIFMKLCLHVPYSVAYTNSCKEIQNFLLLNKKLLYQSLSFFFPISCHSYTGGIQKGTTIYYANTMIHSQSARYSSGDLSWQYLPSLFMKILLLISTYL